MEAMKKLTGKHDVVETETMSSRERWRKRLQFRILTNNTKPSQ